MKSINRAQIGRMLVAASLAVCGSSVYADSTWNFSSCNSTAANQATANKGTFGNSWSCSGTTAGNKVTVTAWGGDNSTGSNGFQTAYVSSWGYNGFGIASKYETINVNSPDHAADNSPANNTPDMFLLKFETAVALGTVTLGWNNSDADFTLMAYTGATPTIAGKIASNSAPNGLTTGGSGSGWALVQQVGDSDPGNVTGQSDTDLTIAVNAANVVSSWWLISAYSAGFSSAAALDTNPDYFKLLSVASKTVTGGKVPEPGSLALMGAAMVGFMATRRRKPQKA